MEDIFSIDRLDTSVKRNYLSRSRYQKGALLILDILFLCLSEYVVNLNVENNSGYLLSSILINFEIIAVSYIFEIYRVNSYVSGLRAPGRVIMSCIVSGALLSISDHILKLWGYDIIKGELVLTVILFFGLYAILTRFILARIVQKQKIRIKYLFIGSYKATSNFVRDFTKNFYDENLTCVVIDDISETDKLDFDKDRVTFEDSSYLATEVYHSRWDALVVDDLGSNHYDLMKDLLKVRLNGAKVFNLNDFYESYFLKAPIYNLEDGWFIFSSGFDLVDNPIGLRFKRIVDIFLALILLLMTLPLQIVFALLIFLYDFNPPLFQQVRAGKKGELFTIYKFRSMKIDAEKDGAQWAQEKDNRITPIGKFIRITRIDELPQVFNILKGDMSFIGPRPERPEFIELLEKEIPYYNLRHLVRPGLTGWAQVLYPYGASREDAKEKLQYDLFYIKNYSPLVDISIIIKTIRVVIFGKGR